MEYRTYAVDRQKREPLLRFIRHSLEHCGCRLLRFSDAAEAPFRIGFETPDGERMGIIAYAFYANRRITKNRPDDEHRFQVKYGTKTAELHSLWQDPHGLYTTLFLGVNPEARFFVGADPVLHSPTRFFISIELKEDHAREILDESWASWERQKCTNGLDEPVEIMVGGATSSFLRYVRFERLAAGLDAGHRRLLAEKVSLLDRLVAPRLESGAMPDAEATDLHQLAAEFQLTQQEILDLIQSAPRLKMAVRGWVAEEHLVRQLASMPEIGECVRLEEEGGPDVRIALRGGRAIFIECKNILRHPYKDGTYRLDLQRTRAAKDDPCSRYYRPEEFDVVAACLHPQTERWEFSYALAMDLDRHKKCLGRLSNLARIDSRWSCGIIHVLQRATSPPQC